MEALGYDARVSHDVHLQAWRTYQHLTVDALAEKAGMSATLIADIESGLNDPSAATLARLSTAMGISPSWLYGHPQDLQTLLRTADEDEAESMLATSLARIDPIIERMVKSAQRDRSLYALVTALMQSGDERLLRAAEVSLRSLVKQLKPADVPWASRQPGHFEPPSD